MNLAHLIDPPEREQDRMREEDDDAIRQFLDAARKCAARPVEETRPAGPANDRAR